MLAKTCGGVVLAMLTASVGHSAEPEATPVPPSVANLKGCWKGRGEVMGKAVTVSVSAKPIVQGAMFEFDTESSALADTKDRYSAHLIFGGASKKAGTTSDQVVGFWADSFGGGFSALGNGESISDGFDITYQYADDAFVNRWRLRGDHLSWAIVTRDAKGVEGPFASYSLIRTVCPPADTNR